MGPSAKDSQAAAKLWCGASYGDHSAKVERDQTVKPPPFQPQEFGILV